MAKLILMRHLQSQFNLENRFAGWNDNPLSKEGRESAKEACLKIADVKIDKVYTSPLIRNRDTVAEVLKCLGKNPVFKNPGEKIEPETNDVPVCISPALNERNYGLLTGMNRDLAMEKYGKEQVHLWRRSWDQAPPEGESLKDVYQRAVPFFQKYAEKDLKEEKNVLIVASHNSLRAIVKHVEKISDEDIINFEIPYGGLLKYNF